MRLPPGSRGLSHGAKSKRNGPQSGSAFEISIGSSALVQERYTKAHGEKDAESPPDPAFVHNSFLCFSAGKVHENPLNPLREEKKEREERSASPPPSSQNEKNKTQEAQKIVSEVSSSLLKIPRTPASPLFEKSHRKRIDTGEKAFSEEMKKILSPEEVGEKPT